MGKIMKWPTELILIRHDTSAFNLLKEQKSKHPLYLEFLAAYKASPDCEKTRQLAKRVYEIFALKTGDCRTPLADPKGEQGRLTGEHLRKELKLPDVIFFSPYKRTQLTLQALEAGWPELRNVKKYEEERIREQEHGLSGMYCDWRVFFALYPEQRIFNEQEGSYWYRFPQGENRSDVRERNRSWIATIVREFKHKRVWAITHHLNILATRANFERFGEHEFQRLDREEKPINCGVTLYRGNPNLGQKGRLELIYYNKKFY
jgi:broad specificity phosphatase PhoE